MKCKWLLYTFFILFCSLADKANAQVSLTGPTCVVPGLQYQYDVSNRGTDTSFQFCITGGVIIGTDSTCSNAGTQTFVRVTWTDSTGGSISVTAPSGTSSLAINMAKPFIPGQIDSTSMIQSVDADSTPASIQCLPPSGGSCSPLYQYQWMQSTDGIAWSDIPGASSAQLSFNSPITQTMYYRCRTSDQNGQSEGLSGVAIITVKNQDQ